jgi:ATP-dependent DNA helicase DinG
MLDTDDIFSAAGPLARALPGYRPRRAQAAMAARVAAAIEARRALIVEAGTGTGKTFAYLVPALLSGRRVLISTGTRTLQDQLFAKDVPLVAAAVGRPAKIALLKGRGNYLCRERFARATAQRALGDFAAAVGDAAGRTGGARELARLERWAAVTASGDLAEVPGFADTHPLWGAITSTRDNCLGQRCAEYARCHVVQARREAQEADVVVVNHHLLLADLALKQDGFGDLLGSADAVILDEAHQIPDLATQFFGSSVGSRAVEVLLGDVRPAWAGAGAPLAELAPRLRTVESALGALLGALPRPPARAVDDGGARAAQRTSWEDSPVDLESFALAISAALRELAESLAAAAARGGGGEAALAQCVERATAQAAAFDRIALCGADEGARTVESTGRTFTLSLLPFDIAERFLALVEARPTAWVFTSATLTVGTDFSHFAARLGLAAAETLQIPSPFDYESQALLYLPRGMPDPASAEYVEAVVDEAMPLIEAAGGGAFLLFTSHRALARAAARVRARWDPFALTQGGRADGREALLLVQGEAPRERLLHDFREHGDAVLLGTASFWEGVDVKGAALRLVIIEKLPFASPDDPLVRARIDYLKRRGGNAFRDYQLPEAVLALKQGFGRLIRSEDDRGVIAICDPRLTSRSYGRSFLGSLPTMPVTQDSGEAQRFLRRLRP